MSVIRSVLLWALPDSWVQYELLAPDVNACIERDMRRRFEGTGVDETELARVIALQIDTLRSFAEDGIILLATQPRSQGDPEKPPTGLSLTLALANRPASGTPGESTAMADGSPAGPSPAASTFISEAEPFILEDPELSAFMRESRVEVPVPGVETPLSRFQAQAFVLPDAQAGMAVITVTTFDHDSEDDARQVARYFANTLCFVTADDQNAGPSAS